MIISYHRPERRGRRRRKREVWAEFSTRFPVKKQITFKFHGVRGKNVGVSMHGEGLYGIFCPMHRTARIGQPST